MRTCLFLTLTLTLLLPLSSPRGVQAQADTKTAAARADEARERFHRGVTLYREGAFRAALIEFQRAYELKPHFALLSNIGQTHLELGDYLAARDALRGFLDIGGAQVPAERRAKVEKQLESLEDRIGALIVSVDIQDADIFLDGEAVGKSPMARQLSVSVGRHVVSVRRSDGQEKSQVVDVAARDIRKLAFELGSIAKAAPTSEPSVPVVAKEEGAQEAADGRNGYRKLALASFISAGVLGASTGVAIFLQKREVLAYEEALDTKDVDPNAVQVRKTNAWRRAVAVDVLGGLTLVTAGAGVVFWMLGRSPEQNKGSNLRIAFTGRGLRLQGDF